MLYSTCKASVTELLSSEPYNLQFHKTFEIRDSGELDEKLNEYRNGSQDTSKTGATKLNHNATRTRPKRPGRGRRRTAKRQVFGSGSTKPKTLD